LSVFGENLPFRQFVLKVHSRCDLACDHCYVYEHADQSWRSRPKVIAAATVERAGERIAEHAADHGLSQVRVILHGGEPLLAGAHRLAEIARSLRVAIDPVCHLDLRIHTNGVRLDAEYCEVFRAENVMVGISLDGDQAANDLHRRYADGRTSYPQVIRAVELLRQDRYQHLYAGLLATIDVRSDPIAVYRGLAALEPPNLDFLLPHATWDTPPPYAGAAGETRYADWLADVFAEWTRDGRRVPVRMFESIVATSRGGFSATESLGLTPSDVAVIETDGTIEQADSIKVAYDGAPATGLDIFAHPLAAAADHPGIRARQLGLAGLSAACRQCPVVTSCGGGLYAHRYRTGNGFDNPSVYCADLEKIITHVRSSLAPAGQPGGAAAQAAGEAAGPVARRPVLTLPAADFDALAAGFGDAGTLEYLNAAQRSIQRSLLFLLREQASRDADDAFAAGFDLLARLDRTNRDTVDEVLAHPYVRAWAAHCLQWRAAPRQSGQPGPGRGYLASIAATIAIRTGVLAEVDVRVVDGYVHLPTLGRLRVGETRTAALTVVEGGFEVRTATEKWRIRSAADGADEAAAAAAAAEVSPDWQPARWLRARDFTVLLEDTDPGRNVHNWPAATRLDDAAAADWQAQFTTAWALITDAYPAYAPGVQAGLRVLMPLANEVPGREISAAAREAYGAVAAALPASGADLALLIIHEFQHVKLGALLDMFDLYDPTDQRLFFAPWREDLRPIGALLQGTYAHLGVTDYWRVRRHHVTGQDEARAAALFARWRVLTSEAIGTLASSRALTPLGERFVAGMRATVDPWLTEHVPPAAEQAARRWVQQRREG
jgi:uncharacterized protein